MFRVTLLGAGMMGTAFSTPLSDRGYSISLVGSPLDDGIIGALREGKAHPRLGLEAPERTEAHFANEAETQVEKADLVALGVSSAGVGWATNILQRALRPGTPLVMITKGLACTDAGLRTFPDQIAAALPPAHHGKTFPAAVAGPCIAGELARRVPTCVVLTGRNGPALDVLREHLRAPYYHLFPEQDVVAAETCAALKNAFAMGVALPTGAYEKTGGPIGSLGFHNTESAVVAQATLEMRRITEALGGDPNIASGLAGVGDLDVTTNGGRTGRFGKFLGRGLSRSEAIDAMDGATLECLEILEVFDQALSRNLIGGLTREDLPLLDHLIAIAVHDRPGPLPLGRFFGPVRPRKTP